MNCVYNVIYIHHMKYIMHVITCFLRVTTLAYRHELRRSLEILALSGGVSHHGQKAGATVAPLALMTWSYEAKNPLEVNLINIKKEVAELSKMESLINQGFKNVTVGLKEVADLLTEISGRPTRACFTCFM